MITLYSQARAVDEYAEELWEEGKAAGKAEGKAEGIAEGKAAGKAEGIAEGKAAGFNLLGKLMDLLFEQNRLDEARRVSRDSALRDRLLKEFKLA